MRREDRGPRGHEGLAETVTGEATSEEYTEPDDNPSILVEATAGKVRPAPREPEITHYGHGCWDRCS
jgi:hypothetical protein